MLLKRPDSLRLALCGCALLAFGTAAIAPAQSARARAARAAVRRQAQPGSFTFGDTTISHYDRISVEFGRRAEAVGPDTVIESVDPKTKVRSQLQAGQIVAFMTPKTNVVERIEATRDVRFSQTRPGANGTAVVRASGSKGTYFKRDQRVVLNGPVRYYAEQPTADGKGKQSVDGTADQATYDGAAQVLSLTGNINMKVMVPDLEEPAPVTGESVRIDLGKEPLQMVLDNPSRQGSVKIKPKQ